MATMATLLLQPAPYGTPLYAQALALRYDQLRKPLGLEFTPEDDACDRQAHHIAALNNHRVVGSISGHLQNDRSRIKIRQMVVAPDCRRQGIGTLLVKAMEDHAARNGITHLFLHARQGSFDFYAACGYRLVGEIFMEHTIPHQRMERLLIT